MNITSETLSFNLSEVIGIGIAGNFAGHLHQAGEAKDFKNASAVVPQGIFPFYLPANENNFLNVFPVSSHTIQIPHSEATLQLEPEVAVLCELIYEGSKIVSMSPKYFAAYNDCSIRKPPAPKISMKKNWGPYSKGLSETLIAIDKFEPGGIMDSFRLASFLKRDGEFFTYGIDSPLREYNYFYSKLLGWLIERMNSQTDEGTLENFSEILKRANYPKQALISLGATAYTEFGEKNFLQKDDQIFVVAYDENLYSSAEIFERVQKEKLKASAISALTQKVI